MKSDRGEEDHREKVAHSTNGFFNFVDLKLELIKAIYYRKHEKKKI